MNVQTTSDQQTAATEQVGVSNATVDACRRGDHSAFHELYERCSRSVYGLMVRMVGHENADDLTQQVFLQVFRSIRQFSGRSRIETWIHRIAVNEALQFLRRNRRRPLQHLESEPADTAHAGNGQLEDKELLDRALARIDPELRALFLLREVQGMSYAELAEAVAVPEGTIGSRLNRARRELRQHLTNLGWKA